jgi:hypothetical protein
MISGGKAGARKILMQKSGRLTLPSGAISGLLCGTLTQTWATPDRRFQVPGEAVSHVTSTFLWAEGAFFNLAGEWMILDTIPTGPRLFTKKLSVMNLRVTLDFLAGSKCSYR